VRSELINTQDTPQLLKDAKAREGRRKQLAKPHIRPLTRFVEKLRKERPDKAVPYFDPLDGGIRAEILYLLEAPGRRAKETCFVSRDNPDETAKNFSKLNNKAGIKRYKTIIWNIVPWYIGDGTRIRGATKADISDGLQSLGRLLTMLINLRVIVLMGRKAEKAEAYLAETRPGTKIYKCFHPSPMFVNHVRGNWNKILRVLRNVNNSR